MDRRVVLVALDWIRGKDPRMTLGHASLLARLAIVPGLLVHSVSRAVNAPDFSREALLEAILSVAWPGCDLAVGAYVWNEAIVQWLLPELCRAGFRGRIIVGGPQVSYAPPGVASHYPDADVLVRGYGEDALAALLTGVQPAEIPGVVVRGGPDSGLPAAIDLSQLPSPILTGTLPVQPFMRWETQRGCIYTCSFCQHRESGARLRHHELANQRIAGEVTALVRGGAREIAVLDPIFNSHAAAADILGRFRAARYTGRLSLQCRFELITDEFLDACAGLDIALEFGLQTTQPAEMRAVQRHNDLVRVDSAITRLQARDIPFEVSLIYGLPNQTVHSFRASVDWCRDRGVSAIRAFPLMLLRGTALEQQRTRWGLVESSDPIPVVVQSDSFNQAEWLTMSADADQLERAALSAGRSAA